MRVLSIALLLLLACVVARAEEAAPRPWADGVSPAAQEAALALFARGNDAFSRSEYAEATRLYREALAAWDHPAIHGNLAVSLIHVDDPVQAYQHLELALRYGPQPFEDTVYGNLLTTRKLLRAQLARVEVRSEVTDAVVSLDAETVLVGAGDVGRFVRAGSHQVVARKVGHLTFTSQVSALPDRPVVVKVVLVPLDLAGGSERRYAWWKPWAVVGGGAALLAIGLGLELSARSDLSGYEQEIARSCPSGCNPSTLPTAVRDLASSARLQHGLAIGAFALGGATVATGGVLAYLNRSRRFRVDENGRRVTLAPFVGPGAIGVVGAW